MANGPVVARMNMYDDFLSYNGGIYRHVNGKYRAEHVVKILGWSEENGLPYWLVANSFNSYWGLGETFKILRGRNECGIEKWPIFAALPDLRRSKL